MKNPLKRFFKTSTVAPVSGGYSILLDDKTLRTPSGNPLLLPVEALAEAISTEWRAQVDTIDPSSMPVAGYANTAIDRIAVDRQPVIDNMLAFAETDLLCYRAEEPADLVESQMQHWQPVLDWAGQTLGAQLRVTTGILPVKQPTKALKALSKYLCQRDDMALTAIASLAAISGSLILALATGEEFINGEQAFEFAQLDESYQTERWGLDSEARDRSQHLKQEMASAVLFLSLIKH